MSLAVLKSLHLLQYENCSCVLLFGGINGDTYSECHSDMPSSPVFTASFGKEPDQSADVETDSSAPLSEQHTAHCAFKPARSEKPGLSLSYLFFGNGI